MNVNYRESAEVPDTPECADGPYCHAYSYGWAAAADAFEYARSVDGVAPVWWLDVQIVSEWAPDLSVNAEAIRGAAQYLESMGVRVGISSTSFQWATVAGTARHERPVWDASALNHKEAASSCRTGKDFGGGTTEQIAYVEAFETVLACGSLGRAGER